MAITRQGPPAAPSKGTAPTNAVAPRSGIDARLAMHSIPYPPVARNPKCTGKVGRVARVDAQRVDAEADGVPAGGQEVGGRLPEPGKGEVGEPGPTAEGVTVVHLGVPSRAHAHQGASGDSAVVALPILDVAQLDGGVGVGGCLGGEVQHHDRRHQRGDVQLVDRRHSLQEVPRRVDVGADVLVEGPLLGEEPRRVEVEDGLDGDRGATAEEPGEVDEESMGEIDHPAPGGLGGERGDGASCGDHRGSGRRRRRHLEEPAPGQPFRHSGWLICRQAVAGVGYR